MIISQDLLNQINAQLDSIESITQPFELNGQFHHFKKGKKEPSSSHVWIIGYTWEYKGNTYQWAKCGDWRTGTNFIVKSYEVQNETKQSLKAATEYIQKAEETAKEEKEKRHTECKDKWKPIFDSLHVESPIHPYLRAKKIKSNFRARVRNESTLLIPVEHPDFGMVGVQQIFKGDDKSYVKVFAKGLRISGSFTRITNFYLSKTPVIYLAEGFATAASVWMATNIPTIACFNCNNLIPAIASIRKINKSVKIIIAGDDDHQTIINGKPANPGRYKANLAVKQFSNIITKFPKFEAPDNLTDFNDLHVTESLEKVTEQLKFSNADFIEIRPLGHKSGRYFYVNSQTSEIVSLSASNHTPDNLMAQAPRKYWGQKYGFIKKDDEITKKPDWDLVKESLFSEQRLIGFFEDDKVRGVGGWLDRGKVVFNSGKYLFVDGVKEPISEHSLQTDFIYEAKKNIDLEISALPNKTEIDDLIKCFEMISYKNPGDYIYLLGTIILAQCPAYWDWRSHIWLTGSRGSGKSTILHWIDHLLFTNGTGIIENATAAGIRGEMGYSAVSLILDEAEAGTIESRRRMGQVMELARQSSSNTGSRVLRGTATGESVSYLLNSLFIMGSIQPSLNNQADVSRFTVIELLKGDPVKFKEMSKISAQFLELKNKLLAFTITYAKLIRDNQKIVRDELIQFNNKIDSRQADQLSWQIAAFWTLKHQKPVDTFQLDMLFVVLNINDSDYLEANQADDEGDCLGAILGVESSERNSIYNCILNQKNIELEKFGIRVTKKINDHQFEVFFHAKNHNLKKALEHTEFHDYAKILRRLNQCVSENKTSRVGGTLRKGLVLAFDFKESDAMNSLDSTPKNDSMQGELDVPF